MSGTAVSFLKEFVTNPQAIGAIAPSSEWLAAAVVDGVDWSRVQSVVEYGPGLGAITEEILKHTHDKDFFAIEVNETYADAFAKRFPNVPLYRDSAANIVDIARSRGLTGVDCVVSGLPWANFSEGLQNELLTATLEAMNAGAQFTTFCYVHGLALKSGKRFRDKLTRQFRDVQRSQVVWKSVPPAVAFSCVL